MFESYSLYVIRLRTGQTRKRCLIPGMGTREGKMGKLHSSSFSFSSSSSSSSSYRSSTRFRLVFYPVFFFPGTPMACRFATIFRLKQRQNLPFFIFTSSSSSIGTTARCGLWPVEQCPSIFFFLSATNSLHLLTPST